MATMPRETGGSGGETGQRRDTERPDDWQRIETERTRRNELQRRYDETHDPSETFEQAARPLGPDHGSERPRYREISAEVAEEFGRTPEQLQRLREKMFAEMAARRERWAASDAARNVERDGSAPDNLGPAEHTDPVAPSVDQPDERPGEDRAEVRVWELDSKLDTEPGALTIREELRRFA